MAFTLVPSSGFQADIDAANNCAGVVLHRFADGALLIMGYDAEIPTLRDRLEATGYVFRILEEDVNGPFAFDGRCYSILDIVDFALWDDNDAVKAKYHEVIERARAEDQPS
jgi:hypothetical protein